MKKALIIFVRNPELGKVKTRLAKSVGDEKALEIYKDLLRHTHEITLDVACDKFIFYADAINTTDIWENNLFNKELQIGNDLGQKMNNAFLKLFQKVRHEQSRNFPKLLALICGLHLLKF